MARLLDAALLGAVAGSRTFTAPAALAARGRLGGPAGSKIIMMAAAGGPGAAAGALGAGLATVGAYRGRAALARRTGLPDPIVGAAEDAVALLLAAAATRQPPDAPDEQVEAPGPPSLPVRLARGLAATAVGTAAMTAAQSAYYAATGAEPSDTPARVGDKILKSLTGRRVKRRHKPALNQAMHWSYGSSWGLVLAALDGPARRAPLPAGAAFGLAVWSASLVELPLLGVAEPVWRQPASQVAADVAFHLVYGVASGAALAGLARR